MNACNFWELLRSKYSELTRSGRRVADYLTQHAGEAQYLSISSLAVACGVAEAPSSGSAVRWGLMAITK